MHEIRVDGGPPAQVAITGVAATTCLGADAESTWRALLAGRCGMGPMPEVESTLPPGAVGGQATDLPSEYSPCLPREARYLRWTVQCALRDAGVPDDAHETSRRLSVFGTTLHGVRAGGRFLRRGDLSELNSFLACETSRLALDGLGIQGGAMTTCSACSSSLGAIALGVTLLETGQADLVVAGGYDVISEYSWAGFNALRLIAEGPLRPFCRHRQGMKVSEGYGIVILERAESAQRRGAAVRACLAGWGESADAYHLTQPHPQGQGALTAMRQALKRAGIRAADLGMVAAHGTGTPDNDGPEFQALSSLLQDALPQIPVVALKSFFGHTLGGAGAVELVMSCMAMRDQRVPACPNVNAADIEFPGLHIPTGKPLARNMNCTLNTSLGFGGANTCVVLTRGCREREPVALAMPAPSPAEVVITGVGILLPGAVGHDAFMDRIARPGPSVPHGPIDRIEDAALSQFLNARRARRLSDYAKYTIAAATMAVRDAGLTECPQSLERAGAILGSMHGSAAFCWDYYSQIVREGVLSANPVLFAEGVPNAAAAHLSTTLGLRGACQTIIGSRTAGLDALALSALRVRSGAIDTLLVVAAEAACEMVDRAYQAESLQARSVTDGGETPGGGFTRGVGAVAFIVEDSRAAAARGASPYAGIAESAWACSPAARHGGPAASIASVLRRLHEPGRIMGSACNTWVDRAERLGMRRAGRGRDPCFAQSGFGELFSVTPFVSLVTALTRGSSGARSSILCTDWSGAASAVGVLHMERRLGSLQSSL
jgi:3-oxoacyl-[acyl-carrier-protein] synthase II